MANMSFTNNATTTLASGITNVATSLTVASGTGSLFPTLTGSQYFYCTLENAAGSTREIVKVTARSTDTFTITRGQDGTTGTAFSTGDKVELRLVRASLDLFPKLDEVNTFSQAPILSSLTGALIGNGASAVTAVAPGTSGNILTSNGTTWTSAAPASTFSGDSGQVFTSNGTFTIPTGITKVKVTVVGGGGGGGGSVSGCPTSTIGAAGGGGGAAIKYLTSLTPGNTLSVTVGAAGTAGTASPSAGGTGGTSQVASGTQTITTISATGGAGGATGSSPGPGLGGVGSNGDLNIGGASATYNLGTGGSSILGGGGASGYSSSFPTPQTGRAYGGGGGAGFYTTAGTAGAAGGAGVVIIEW